LSAEVELFNAVFLSTSLDLSATFDILLFITQSAELLTDSPAILLSSRPIAIFC
jgi:hypothetical protein